MARGGIGTRGRTRHRASTVIAGLGGVAFLAFGLWAMAAPRTFFERLATFEPYNQHFIQDIGAFQIGLGATLLLAVMLRLDAVAVALLGVGVGGAAHAVSHVIGRDLGGTPSVDIPSQALIALILLGAGAARARALGRRGA